MAYLSCWPTGEMRTHPAAAPLVVVKPFVMSVQTSLDESAQGKSSSLLSLVISSLKSARAWALMVGWGGCLSREDDNWVRWKVRSKQATGNN